MSGDWDLIVVGAGSAGSAVASRCAERGMRVLLLEAGPDYRSAEMPEVWRSPNPLRALLHPEDAHGLVWPDLFATRTASQEPLLYWRGRGVGGSSAVNGQIAIRPPREDFDDWAAAGCKGWSWDEVLPYFCRLEADQEFGDQPYHGDSGPTPVYRAPRSTWGSVDEALAVAATASGFRWAPDVNAPGATGISPYPINSRDYRRVSTNDAYLEPARALRCLSILGDAVVDRILFSGERAVGVEFGHGGEHRVEHGDRIVLCAGVIHSPTVLMRSGIGPADLLQSLEIDVLCDLPVGQGLQDHPMIGIAMPLRAEAAIKTPDDRHTNCCVRYSSEGPRGTFNDMMLVSLNQAVLAMETADTSSGAGAIGVFVNQPYSRGSARLSSCDPERHPIVVEGMLSDQRDLDRLASGARLLADLATADAVQAICAFSPERVNAELFAALRSGDDKELESYLLAAAVDTQHGTSTCRMGPSADPDAVVDLDCSVLGVRDLWVADASIFPSVPRANTNLATIMVGELLADRLS